MLKVEIKSDCARHHNATLALFLQKALDDFGIKSIPFISTVSEDYSDRLEDLVAFSKVKPVFVEVIDNG